jgi:hypothetical protein
MKERLIKLINNSIDEYRTAPIINGVRDSLAEFLADHLLANGVVELPCAVGDTIYVVDKIWEIVEKGKVVGCRFKNGNIKLLVEIDGVEHMVSKFYPTEADAEKALNERI